MRRIATLLRELILSLLFMAAILAVFAVATHH